MPMIGAACSGVAARSVPPRIKLQLFVATHARSGRLRLQISMSVKAVQPERARFVPSVGGRNRNVLVARRSLQVDKASGWILSVRIGTAQTPANFHGALGQALMAKAAKQNDRSYQKEVSHFGLMRTAIGDARPAETGNEQRPMDFCFGGLSPTGCRPPLPCVFFGEVYCLQGADLPCCMPNRRRKSAKKRCIALSMQL